MSQRVQLNEKAGNQPWFQMMTVMKKLPSSPIRWDIRRKILIVVRLQIQLICQALRSQMGDYQAYPHLLVSSPIQCMLKKDDLELYRSHHLWRSGTSPCGLPGKLPKCSQKLMRWVTKEKATTLTAAQRILTLKARYQLVWDQSIQKYRKASAVHEEDGGPMPTVVWRA